MQPRFLYRPLRDICYTPAHLDIAFEDVVFDTPDGLKLHGWYIPVQDSEFTILFCHGNGGNIMHRLDSLSLFRKLGFSCFIFDYRGYGRSQGKPGEKGTYVDVCSAYRWLRRTKRVSAERIIVFGRSLGGCMAARLACKARVRALVLESSFTSYVDMGRKFYPYMPVRWFARFGYETITHVRRIKCPLLVIHSRQDEIVPFEFGIQLFESGVEPKTFVEISGGHNDGFLTSGDVYEQAWMEWTSFLVSGNGRQQASQKSAESKE